MEPQEPAVGILKFHDWGNTMTYRVQCDCGDDICSHLVDVEADDYSVSVHLYTTMHTKWWEKSRWRQIWEILTKGRSEYQSTIILRKQAAINYGSTILKAVDDIEKLGKK